MTLEQAVMGVFITLKEPTKEMSKTAKAAGIYQNRYMSRSCDRIQIVTIKEILEDNKRLDVRLSFEVIRSAEKHTEVKQMELDI
jgi:ClpP class serine protease